MTFLNAVLNKDYEEAKALLNEVSTEEWGLKKNAQEESMRGLYASDQLICMDELKRNALLISLNNLDYTISFWLMAHNNTNLREEQIFNLNEAEADIYEGNLKTMRCEGMIA
jgi:hypothetical protein